MRMSCRWIGAFLLVASLRADAAPPTTGWPLVYGDEFAGATIDSAKWKYGQLPWGGQHHNDQYASYITPDDSYVQNGSLWLRCRKATGGEFGGYPWSEGFVYNDGIRNFTYGYVEIRARFASGRGTWPAFWMLSWGWPPEFDIAEYFGSDDRMHMGLAYGPSWDNMAWDSTNFYGLGVSTWHSYGLEWGPGYAIWYMDGSPRKSIYADYVPAQPMYVILNSGMTWDFDNTTPNPNDSEVDYCRVYDPPAATINDNTTGTGQNQFNYTGVWDYYASQDGAFFHDNHWSAASGSYYQVLFNGSRVDVYAAKAPNHGLAAVSVDGGAETNVDFYAASRTDKALVWASPSLTAGTHALKVRVTGMKNAASSGYFIPADRVDVWPSSNRLAGTIVGTTGSWGSSGNTRDKAFDGDPATFFDAPAPSGAWTGLDFGANTLKRITRVSYWPRAGYADRMVEGRFQGANDMDFATAVDLFTITTTPFEEGRNDQPVANPAGFRYVRYLSPPNAYCNVAELEFEGTLFLPAPANLTATAIPSQVVLCWSASAGATGYMVRRSTTAGGPYEVIATPAITSFTDTTVVNGITYYYVVSATGQGVESANSSEVSAKPIGPHFDFDEDLDVDQTDLQIFLACMTREGVPGPPAGCSSKNFAAADADGDGDVDQSDFGWFQTCLSGSGHPADPACR